MNSERWIYNRIEAGGSKYSPLYSAALESFIPPLPALFEEAFQYYEDKDGNTVIRTGDEYYARIRPCSRDPRYFPFAVLRQDDFNMIRNFILKADDRETGELVIAKTAHTHKVLKEAEIMQVSRHPNVAELLDAAVAKKGAYIIMEWLPGSDLADWVKQGNHFISDVALVFGQAAGAIDSVNRQGYVYADAKPTNIMFDRRDNVKLIDFENCSLIDNDDNSAPNSTFVTYKYAPPEQLDRLGEARLYLQSDVYSLGAVLYEMLTGDRGYKAEEDRISFINGHEPLIILDDYSEALSLSQQEELARILRCAMATDYKQRHPNVRALNEEVQSILIV